MRWLRQPANSRRVARSMPREDGDSHGASFQRATTGIAMASILTISLLSSRLVKTNPFPSATEDSGPPPSSTVPNTFPSAASITVELALPPLLAKMRLVASSYTMASGFFPVGTVPIACHVFRSNMVTLSDVPLVMKPRPTCGATAMPCAPCAGIEASTAPESRSSTCTWVACGTYNRRAAASPFSASLPDRLNLPWKCAALLRKAAEAAERGSGARFQVGRAVLEKDRRPPETNERACRTEAPERHR